MRFPLLDWRENRAGNAAGLGALLVLFGGFGSRRRYPHWPFDLAAYSPIDWLLVAVGGPLCAAGGVLWLLARREQHTWRQKTSGDWYARETLPRSICQLLLTVATADGRVDDVERERIETFLVRRMQKGVVPQDVKNWAATTGRAADPRALAAHIGALLDERERRELHGWCSEVALADGGIDDDEREVLAAIAQGLQLPAPAGGAARRT